MPQGIGQTFACPHCGKRFTWHARFAGKKLSCSCGGVFEPTLGLEEAGVERAAYDVGTTPVADKQPIAPPPRRDIAALYPRRTKTVAASAAESNELPRRPIRDIVIPSILLVAGMTLLVIQVLRTTRTSMPAVILVVLLATFLNAAVMLGGAYVAALALGVEFGAIPVTALKLSAISLFATGLAAMAAGLDHSQWSVRGQILGLYLVVFLYFILFFMLFELDLLEALSTTVIVWVLQLIVQIALFSMLSNFTGSH